MKENKWVKKVYKFIKIYICYILPSLAVFIAAYLVEAYISSIDADFVEPPTGAAEENNVTWGKVSYNYFLDFSPSMLGFLNDDVNLQMNKIAEIFEQVNAGNENNSFYWCGDEIESVADVSVFYKSMKTQQELHNYWWNKMENEEFEYGINQEEEIEAADMELNGLQEMIDNIDLSKIFSSGFTRPGSDAAGSLNVIVTDLNFMKTIGDGETHNTLLDRLARYLGGEVADADICIYVVDSEFEGITDDEFTVEWDKESRIKTQFYLIIYSENTDAYKQYAQQFEELMSANVLPYRRFEMLNNPGEAVQGLKTEISSYQNLGMIEQKEHINFANGMFENLDGNEFAIQLVSGGNGTLAMPVSRIELPGYYDADIVGLDNTKIDMEVELYRPVNRFWPFRKQYEYELFDDTGFVLMQSAGLYYGTEQWFLRINMILNTNPDVPLPESDYQKLLEGMGRKYFVMNLKFYLTKPSYSKPDWIDEVVAGQTTGNGASDIAHVIDAVIRSKENAFASHSQEDRYIGNEVVYILY